MSSIILDQTQMLKKMALGNGTACFLSGIFILQLIPFIRVMKMADRSMNILQLFFILLAIALAIAGIALLV